MTSVKFIIKVKANHNPPKFHEDLDEGVLQEVIVDFKTDDPISVAFGILNHSDEMIKYWIEVITEPVKELQND